MSIRLLSSLAEAILWLHVGIILFNVLGLAAIPLGAWRGWAFVRVFWWRAAHLAILAVVALQAALDRVCFLTDWQDALTRRAGDAPAAMPLVERWVVDILFWPVPPWIFGLVYIAAWVFALLLWRWVPPRMPAFRRAGRRGRTSPPAGRRPGRSNPHRGPGAAP